MKKYGLIFLSVLFVLGLVAGCASNDEPTSAPEESEEETVEEPEQMDENEGDGAEAEEETSSEFESMTIALGHNTADTEDSHTQQAAVKFKEIVEDRTNGAVTVEIHPNGVLGGEREMLEAVQIGTLDMIMTSTGPVGNFAPIVNALDFPFLFRDWDHAYSVLDGEIGDEISMELENKGLKVLAWAENGFRHITNSRHPITEPEDLNGIVIRTMENQVHLELFRDFGADPTPMDFTELFTAMQQGVVDGQENPLAIIMPNRFYEAQNYLTLSGHVYSPLPIIIGVDLFNSFTPELQDIFVEAGETARDHEREFVQQMDEGYLQIAEENGFEIVTADEFDYDAFFEASQPVYETYADDYGEILGRIQAQ